MKSPTRPEGWAMQDAVWKQTKFPLYEASTAGQIRKRTTKRLLRPATSKGYQHVSLYVSANSKRINYRVHRLIAETFVPNSGNLPVVNHKNCIQTDNRASNLEWVSVLGNYVHALKNRRYKSYAGATHWARKIPVSRFPKIKEWYSSGKLTQTEIARKFGVNQAEISRIINNNPRRGKRSHMYV